MWIELMFRDVKSGGREWERSLAWRPERASRLWLALALAYAWMASLGVAALGSDKAVKEVSDGRSRAARYSLFRLGVDVFRLCIERGRSVVCSLLFPSGLERAAKSVAQQARKGKRDPLAGICTWFRAANLAASVWIPRVRGRMTGANSERRRNDSPL